MVFTFPYCVSLSVEVLDSIDFWVLPSALLLYSENIKQTILPETTMPSTSIFGKQHHLTKYASTNFIQLDPPVSSDVHFRNLLGQSSCLTPQGIEHRYLLGSITQYTSTLWPLCPTGPTLGSHVLHRLIYGTLKIV